MSQNRRTENFLLPNNSRFSLSSDRNNEASTTKGKGRRKGVIRGLKIGGAVAAGAGLVAIAGGSIAAPALAVGLTVASKVRKRNRKNRQTPIIDDNLRRDVLKKKFNDLIGDIIAVHRHYNVDNVDRNIYKGLNQRLINEVKKNPILARVISEKFLHWSLLMTICSKLEQKWIHPAIKFLIETNPAALLWKGSDLQECNCPIYTIAYHRTHYALMPWIAEQFPWVLDHPQLHGTPPALRLVSRYSDGGCDKAVVQKFFENYPKGLGQVDGKNETPLHKIIWALEACDVDFFIWMAERHPDSMIHKDHMGWTPLHCACLALLESSTDNLVQISNFLIQRCPQSVRSFADKKGILPIHILNDKHDRREVQDVLLLLLREYPESIDTPAKSANFSVPDVLLPSSFPFIKQIKPHLESEFKLKNKISILQEEKSNFVEALSCSKDILLARTSEIFAAWYLSNIKTIEAGFDVISHRIEEERLCGIKF